jgi:hypothetical protein
MDPDLGRSTLIQVTPHMRLLVAHQPVDFRKGIDGLVRICKDQLDQDPFNGTMFIFRNRPQTGIKILIYDGQGFWLCHKRLSKGRFKWWPTQGKKCTHLEALELQALIAAGNPMEVSSPDAWRPLSKDGPQIAPAGVPKNPPIVYSHAKTDANLSQTRHPPNGHPVHSRPNRKIPGIQPS